MKYRTIAKAIMVLAFWSTMLSAQADQRVDQWHRLVDSGNAIAGAPISSLADGELVREVRATYEAALEIARSPGFPPLLLAESLVRVASWTGDPNPIRFLEEALEIRRQELGDNAPEVADLLVLLEGKGEAWQDSRSVLEEAQQIYRTSLGADSPKAAYLNLLLGVLDRREGDTATAERRFREALLMAPAYDDPDNVAQNNVAQSARAQLISLLEEQGRSAEKADIEAEFEAVSAEANRTRLPRD